VDAAAAAAAGSGARTRHRVRLAPLLTRLRRTCAARALDDAAGAVDAARVRGGRPLLQHFASGAVRAELRRAGPKHTAACCAHGAWRAAVIARGAALG
jgi:hypothetical protein